MLGLLRLLVLPLLLARFDMDFETGSTEFPTADIANERLWLDNLLLRRAHSHST